MAVEMKPLEEIGKPIHIQTKKLLPTMADLAEDIESVEKVGKWLFRSKFFGCDYEEQAHVIAMECYLTGVTPLEYLKKNKIVAGKPFKQYDSMLAEFNSRGGKHKILKFDSEGSSIEFTWNEKKETFSLLWEDFRKEPTPYLGKEADIVATLEAGKTPAMKPKYATPLSRKTMLFARLVSSSIRALCPEVNFGVYTEEELSDFVETESVTTVKVAEDPSREDAKRKKREEKLAKTEAPKEVAAPEQPEAPKDEPKQEATEAKSETKSSLEGTEGPQTAKASDPITEIQRERIISLMAQCYESGVLDIKEKITEVLKKNNLERLADLSQLEADFFISALTEKNVTAVFEASFAGHKNSVPS